MHILTLKPTLRSLSFAAFRDGSAGPVLESTLDQCQFDGRTSRFPDAVFEHIQQTLRRAELAPPDVIGVRALYGGERFPRPVLVTDGVLDELAQLAHEAPLHVPTLIEFVQSLRHALIDTPVALVFETFPLRGDVMPAGAIIGGLLLDVLVRYLSTVGSFIFLLAAAAARADATRSPATSCRAARPTSASKRGSAVEAAVR